MTRRELAEELSTYTLRERLGVYRAAKLLAKYNKLTKEQLTREEELAMDLAEFEEV